jgi:uncharacterized membrane protein
VPFFVALSEELWNLGEAQSLASITAIAAASWLLIGPFIHRVHHLDDPHRRSVEFVRRICATCIATFLICAAILGVMDELPMLDVPMVALKRTVLAAFPASFAATDVDSSNRSWRPQRTPAGQKANVNPSVRSVSSDALVSPQL